MSKKRAKKKMSKIEGGYAASLVLTVSSCTTCARMSRAASATEPFAACSELVMHDRGTSGNMRSSSTTGNTMEKKDEARKSKLREHQLN